MEGMLNKLPPPPENKVGWPWTEESLSENMLNANSLHWPRISIVTPSFNQGPFLEETIRSVLLQNYPNLEYYVIDGGSTDNSVEIIKKYEKFLTGWVSEKDRGQSHAINKGWSKCTGEIFAYLNSDDIYYPKCLEIVATEMKNSPDNNSVLFGSIAFCNEYGQVTSNSSAFLPSDGYIDLTLLNPTIWHLPQASSFFARSVLETVGLWVREDLQYTMDRELIYRAVRSSKVIIVDDILATYRHHENAKTTALVLDSYLESSKAYSYCDWGNRSEKIERRRILRKRIAMGYLAYGGKQTGFRSIYFMIQAVINNPLYITNASILKKTCKRMVGIRS